MSLYCNKEYLDRVKNNNFIRAVNEVYFGETPGILRCFETFCEFRNKYITNKAIFTGNMDADHDKDLGRFINEIEREFGLHSYSFIVINDDTRNAFTIVPFFRGSDIVEVNKNGYRFKKEAEVSMITCCYTGLLFDSEYTNREIFAIILHEIGHNFQDIINSTISSLHDVSMMMILYVEILRLINLQIVPVIKDAIQIGVFSNKGVSVLSKLYNKISFNNENKKTIYTYFNYMKGIVSSVRNIALVPVYVAVLPIMTIANGVLSFAEFITDPIGGSKNYLGERFADGFPVSYGFGPDIARANQKLTRNASSNKLQDKALQIPIIGHIINTLCVPGFFLTNAGDCHPSSVARVKSVIRDMKTDLKDPNLNPKLRKQLEKEIKEIETNMDNYFKEAKRIDNPEVCQVALDSYIYYKCDGGFKLRKSDDIVGGVRTDTNKTTSRIANVKLV